MIPICPELPRIEALVLFGEEKYDEARKRAKDWIEDHPDDAEVDAILIRSMIRLGWWDLANLRLATWPRFHPLAVSELGRLRDETTAASGKTPDQKSPFEPIRF